MENKASGDAVCTDERVARGDPYCGLHLTWPEECGCVGWMIVRPVAAHVRRSLASLAPRATGGRS